jgi:hypothetical protein
MKLPFFKSSSDPITIPVEAVIIVGSGALLNVIGVRLAVKTTGWLPEGSIHYKGSTVKPNIINRRE